MTAFAHSLTGRTFVVTEHYGRFGASSVDGVWDSGEVGTIFPGELLADGSLVWAQVA